MEAARGQPSTPKREAVQAAVLRATEELLSEGTSWGDLGIERIATRAGISRTAFYFYFRDKREVLMRLAAELVDLLYKQADIWFSGGEDVPAEIRESLSTIAALYDEHSALIRAIVELSTYDDEVAGFWRTLLGRFVEATEQRIESGLPPNPTAFALVWMTERTLYQQLVQEQPQPRDELIDALTAIWLRSVYNP